MDRDGATPLSVATDPELTGPKCPVVDVSVCTCQCRVFDVFVRDLDLGEFNRTAGHCDGCLLLTMVLLCLEAARRRKGRCTQSSPVVRRDSRVPVRVGHGTGTDNAFPLQSRAEGTWLRRWSAMLSCGAARRSPCPSLKSDLCWGREGFHLCKRCCVMTVS